jgi:hypothetical protein
VTAQVNRGSVSGEPAAKLTSNLECETLIDRIGAIAPDLI